MENNGTDIETKQCYDSKMLLSNAFRKKRRANFNELMVSLCQNQMHSASVWFSISEFHKTRIKQIYSNTIKYKKDLGNIKNRKS